MINQTWAMVLMTSGVRFALILLIILIIGGGITYLVVKEHERKAKAKARAEERHRLREEALARARSGNAEAFSRQTKFDPKAAGKKDSEKTKKKYEETARRKTVKNNLDTLLDVRTEDDEKLASQAAGKTTTASGTPRFSTEAVTLPKEASSKKSSYKETSEAGISKEAFGEMTSKEVTSLEENAFDRKEKSSERKPEKLVDKSVAVEVAKAEKTEQKSRVNFAKLAALLDEDDKIEDPIKEPVKDPKALKFSAEENNEDDLFDLESFAKEVVAEEVPEEVSKEVPETNEIVEELIEETPAEEAVEEATVGEPAVTVPSYVEAEIHVDGPEDAEPEEPMVSKTAAETVVIKTIRSVEKPEWKEEAEAEEEYDEEDYNEEDYDEEDYEEGYDDEPYEDDYDEDAQDAYRDVDFDDRKPSDEKEKTERVRTVNGIERMTPEEADAYRTQRLEALDKYAAQLAAADDEDYDEKYADEYDDYDEPKKHNGGRVFLWFLAAILVLVCIGAILYMMFGSFLKPSATAAETATEEAKETKEMDGAPEEVRIQGDVYSVNA